MSNFILLSRNPSSNQVVAIQNGDDVAMFETYEDAEKCAEDQTLCVVWGFQIVEVEV